MALLETLTDDFSAGTLDTGKWTVTPSAGITYNLTGGTFNINTAAGFAAANATFTLASKNAYTLAESYAAVQVTTPGSLQQDFEMRIAGSSGGERFYFLKSGGPGLVMQGYDGSNYFAQVSPTYDPVAMAWWRLRRTGTGLYWETSPDGNTWTARTSIANYTLKATTYSLNFYTYWSITSSATTAKIDNVNVTPPPPYTATVTPTGINDVQAIGDPTATTTVAAVNRSYPTFRDGLMTGDYGLLTGNIKLALVSGYTFDVSHRHLSDVLTAGATVNGTSPALTGPTVTNASFDADDTAITTAANPSPHTLVAYQASSPSGGPDLPADEQRLMWYFPAGVGLPVTPGAGTVTVAWPNTAGKIYKIG